MARIRRGLNEKSGIPEEAIVFSCTHTHAGPGVVLDGYTVPTPGDYPSFLIAQAVASGAEAWRKRAPARVGFGRTEVFELGRGRRALLYGGLHPDPEVLIMKIEDAAGRLKGVAYNYGCHPSTLDWKNTLFSGDWPNYPTKASGRAPSGRVWTAYLQGAEGDINTGYSSELSAVGVDMAIRDYWYIEKKGQQMADVCPQSPARRSRPRPTSISLRPGRLRLSLARELPRDGPAGSGRGRGGQKGWRRSRPIRPFRGTRILDQGEARGLHHRSAPRSRPGGSTLPRAARGRETIEHQALRIGPAVFSTLPGQVFSEIGLHIKRDPRSKMTFPLGLANGYGLTGYLPPAKEFAEGDYEVDGSLYSPEAEDACVTASVTMIRRVLPG